MQVRVCQALIMPHHAGEGLSGPHHAENECRCSLVFFATAPSPPPTQAARTYQKPPGRANHSSQREATSHWLRGSGGSRCILWHDVTHEDHSLTHAYLYSQSRFGRPITRLPQRAPVEGRRDRANVANNIIIDIFYLLWKPPNLSCIFDIIFVVEYVLVFDTCHS